MENYWKKDLENNIRQYPALDKNISVDTVVIGGGLAGVMCAYTLSKRGKSVAIIEADCVGCGEVAKSSAMISYAHDLIYSTLLDEFCIADAKQYLDVNREGLECLREIIFAEKIECEYETCDMVLFATKKIGVRELINEQQAYLKLGVKTELVNDCKLPFNVKMALRIPNQGQLNPYKFVRGVAQACQKNGVQIFENTRVTQTMKDGLLLVGDVEVRAKDFVIATHFPYINSAGLYFAKMYQSRSHNIIFSTKEVLPIELYESAEENGFEYRRAGDNILCGGASVRTGKYKYRSRYRVIEKQIERHFPDAQMISRISAQDCMTFDSLPFIGRYAEMLLPNVYVVTGFNKWGFTTSAAASKIIADQIDGKIDYNIFEPSRAYLTKTLSKTFRNVGTLLASFSNLVIMSDAKKLSRIKCGQGAIVRSGLKRIGVYRNMDGSYKAVAGVCPHMGCSLKWNKDEKSWDCPCHGSRFDVDGNILSSPTTEKANCICINHKDDKKE